MGITFRADVYASVREAVPDYLKVVEVVAIDGPLSRGWQRLVHSKVNAIMRRLPDALASGMRTVMTALAGGVAWLDRRTTVRFGAGAQVIWMAFKRDGDV